MNQSTPNFIFEAVSVESYKRMMYIYNMDNVYTRQVRYFAAFQNLIDVFPECKVVQDTRNKGHFLNEERGFIVSYQESNLTLDVNYHAPSQEVLEEISSRLKEDEVRSSLKWVHNKDGNYSVVPLSSDKSPLPSFYPFLSKPLYEFYDDYMNSSQNILILIGPPGCGKSSFIRGLLQHTQKKGVVSYDANVLASDSVFGDFLDGEESFFILEDSDTLISPREEGNNLVSKFLNVSDGIVSTKTKKMIFTTNLPSTKNIDHALTRPGRCYDIIDFRALNKDEANIIRSDFGLEEQDFGGTLAEITNERKTKNKSSFGFI